MEEMGGYLVGHAVAGGTTTCQSPLLSLASASTLEKGTAAGGWVEAGPPPHWRRAPPPEAGSKLGRRDP